MHWKLGKRWRHLFTSNLKLFGIITLENNTANYGGAIHMAGSQVRFGDNNYSSMSFQIQNSTIFRGNKATNLGGCIGSHNSIINFDSNVVLMVMKLIWVEQWPFMDQLN